MLLLFFVLDRGRIVSPAYSRLRRAARSRASRQLTAARCGDPVSDQTGRTLMAIGVKVLDRPIEETSYLRATLKGMSTDPQAPVHPHKVTHQYPEEK